MTIKRKLLGLTITGLAFVLAISATGYWGITTVEETTAEVAATGSAIRNHVEAGVYNDMTRSDISAVFNAKGDARQNKLDDLAQHSRLLKDRIAKTDQLLSDTTLRARIAQESRMVDQYVGAGESLARAIAQRPSEGIAQLTPYLQAYKQLQQNIEETSDLLEKGARAAQSEALGKATEATRAMLVMCGLSFLLLLLIATRIIRSITEPLDSLSSRFKAMTESNDLRLELDQERNDEIGALGLCLNTFVHKLHEILTQIRRSAEQVAEVTEEISTSAKGQAQGAESQNDQASQVATAMQQMSATVIEVSENSNRAAEAARKASETARHGGKIVDETLAKMRVIAGAVTASAKKMEELGKSSDQIGRIVAVIDDIADQTNLLALNAAIEAARAGEQGRGFAVVADEVRKLAERTTTATKEIAQMIRTIQADMKSAVRAMEEGTVQVQDGVQSTVQAGDSLREIIHTAEQVGEMVTHIATAGTQQSATSEHVKERMQQIAVLVNQTATEARNSAQACQGLSELAVDLQKMVANFQLRSDDGFQRHCALPSDGDQEGRRGNPAKSNKHAFAAAAN
jgi:methyl-accepting chemotaxis protein